MKTKKQEALVASFLKQVPGEDRALYRELIGYLSELEYHPYKERSNIIFKCDEHNKQMAKIGIKKGKTAAPFFALRFSACRGYSPRFAAIVEDAVVRYPSRAARCTDGGCGFCAGEPATHVYTHVFPEGERRCNCGAYALEIPNLAAEDLAEIRRLLGEEHEYLMAHEAGQPA